MNTAVDIIKHGGKRPTEKFARNKLHTSIVAACLSVRTPEGQAETTANAVCNEVIDWLKGHSEVTSNDIRVVATRSLKKYHSDAAYLYEQHKIII